MEGAFGRSPFENVFRFLNTVPQSHEKALKHALYNAIALILVFICGATGWGVFYVLKPFVKPLIWAFLIGSVLHPFKHAVAKRFQLWIHHLEESNTPIFLFLCTLPVRLMDDISEKLGTAVVCNMKFLLSAALGAFTIFALYNFVPSFCITILTAICEFNYQFLLFIMENLSSKVFVAMIVGYAVVLSYYWSEESSNLFSISSYCVWFMISLYAARFFGILQVPLFLLLLFCLSFGFAFEIITVLDLTAENISYWNCVQETVLGKFYKTTESDHKIDEKSDDEAAGNSEKAEAFSSNNASHSAINPLKSVAPNKPWLDVNVSEDPSLSHAQFSVGKGIKPGMVASPKDGCQDESGETMPSSIQTTGKNNANNEDCGEKNGKKQGMEQSSKYICGVLWACSAMMLWKYFWIVHLLPIPIAIYFIKNIGNYFGVWNIFYSQWKELQEAAASWIEHRERAIFPAPVQGLRKIILKLRLKTMITVRQSINSFASSLVIMGLIFFTFSFTIFIALQIYAEGLHLITVGAEIINSTVVHNPEFLQLLPQGWGEKVDSALNNAYVYGREGISRQVQHLLKDVDKAKAEEFEKHLLEFWDRVYQAWLMGSLEKSTMGPTVNNAAVFTSWKNFMDVVMTPDIFNVSVIADFVKENVEMFVSLLDSVWILLKGNINLISQFLFSALSILLGGGTAVLNFVVSLIVFFTALFYLLSSSGALYKPVDLLSNVSPVNGKRLAMAFEAAVNGVFKASFKMALFYGLWTWLIHNLFQVRIVYLPSVLAATLGAVPFLGTYWASIPAILDLWLAQHNGMLAILLLIFQSLPISFVDAAIYAEIKGGGHPYMTGLAIAGGVFCMGIEGAIFGPVLLCCLLVALNMSSSLMKDSPTSELPHIPVRQLRRLDTVL